MDVDIAQCTLQTYIVDKNKIYKLYQLFREALLFISGESISNSVINVVNILAENVIQCQTGNRKGEWLPVENTLNHRLIIYRYLESIDYTEIDLLTTKTLFQQLIKCASNENNIVPILKIINLLLKQKKHVADGFSIIAIIQQISFIRDQHSERWILNVLDTVMANYFKPTDCVDIIRGLVHLSHFGIAEFLISASAYKVIAEPHRTLYIRKLLRYAMQGFSDNNIAFGASLLFNTVIQSIDSNCFVFYFNRYIRTSFAIHPNSCSRTLLTSFTKYIVPLCGARYQMELIEYTSYMHLYYKLIICKYIYIATSYARIRICLGAIIQQAAYSEDITITSMGFELLCYYHNTISCVSNEDICMFQKMLSTFTEITVVIRRSIRYFISQIVIRYSIEKNLSQFLYLYNWIYKLLNDNLLNTSPYIEIITELFCFTQEVIHYSSDSLVCPYVLGIKYERCPLFIDLQGIIGNHCYYTTFIFLYNTFKNSSRDMPLIGNILIRVYSKWLDNYMVEHLYESFVTALQRKSDWSTQKSLHAMNMLLKRLSTVKQYKTLRLIEQLISDSLIKSFNELKSIQQLDDFVILLHVKALKMIIKELPKEYIYVHQCKRTIYQMERLIIESAAYSQDTFRNKSIRKNVEAILLAMIDLVFTTSELTNYVDVLVDDILFICSSLLTNNPMKKVIVYVSQRLRELIIATPQYEYKYISFYETEKKKYINHGIQPTLRKSAGIRNFMHVIFKSIKRLDFLPNEIEALIRSNTTQEYQLNLQLNLLESIIGDTDLKLTTKKFLPTIFRKALINIDNKNFMTKNASIQLISAIVLRLLGPVSEDGVRELSAADVFITHPELASVINEFLFEKTSSFEIIILILCFLSESNCVGHMRTLESPFSAKLLKRFFSFYPICKYAVEAFVAMIPNNDLYHILLDEYKDMKVFDESSLYNINQINIIIRLTDRYMGIFPDSAQYEEILKKKWELLDRWEVRKCVTNYFPQYDPTVTDFTSQKNNSALLLEMGQVNQECHLCYLKCIDKFIYKPRAYCNYNINFFKTSLKYLTEENRLIPGVMFGLKEVIINSLGYLENNIVDLIDHMESVEDLNIHIQELLIIIICKKNKWEDNDLRIVNSILKCFVSLILQNISMTKVIIILNIMESLVDFLYIYNISMINFLFITFTVTYMSPNHNQLRNIYHGLTGGHIRNPRSALFLILNNLEVYLKDTFFQKKLLIKYSEYITRPSHFNRSYIYRDPDNSMDKINFTIKLNENVIFLLDSIKFPQSSFPSLEIKYF